MQNAYVCAYMWLKLDLSVNELRWQKNEGNTKENAL